MKRIIMFIILSVMCVSCCPKAVCTDTCTQLPTGATITGPEVKCWMVPESDLKTAGLTCPTNGLGLIGLGSLAVCSYKVNYEVGPYNTPHVISATFRSLESEGDIKMCGCRDRKRWHNAKKKEKYVSECNAGTWLNPPRDNATFFVMFRHVYGESTIEAHTNFVASNFRFIW